MAAFPTDTCVIMGLGRILFCGLVVVIGRARGRETKQQLFCGRRKNRAAALGVSAEYLFDNSLFTVYSAAMETQEEVKKRIFAAADARFRQYGFNKTTMAEIAQDCGMSPANIYRFYNSKSEIVAEMATTCFRNKEEIWREILRRPGLSAAERLEAFVLETMRITHARVSEQPKLKEVVDCICRERNDLVSRHKEIKQSLLAEILAEGNRSGEFDVPDVVGTAETILQATALAEDHQFVGNYSLPELETIVQGIVRLLVRGLKK